MGDESATWTEDRKAGPRKTAGWVAPIPGTCRPEPSQPRGPSPVRGNRTQEGEQRVPQDSRRAGGLGRGCRLVLSNANQSPAQGPGVSLREILRRDSQSGHLPEASPPAPCGCRARCSLASATQPRGGHMKAHPISQAYVNICTLKSFAFRKG